MATGSVTTTMAMTVAIQSDKETRKKRRSWQKVSYNKNTVIKNATKKSLQALQAKKLWDKIKESLVWKSSVSLWTSFQRVSVLIKEEEEMRDR